MLDAVGVNDGVPVCVDVGVGEWVGEGVDEGVDEGLLVGVLVCMGGGGMDVGVWVGCAFVGRGVGVGGASVGEPW